MREQKKRESKAERLRAFREKAGLPDPVTKSLETALKQLRGFMASDIETAQKRKLEDDPQATANDGQA